MFDVTLDKKTAHDIYVIAEGCLNVQTLDGFSQDVIARTQCILGQEMTACGIGAIDTMQILSTLNVGFPSDFIAAIINIDKRCQSPLFRRWLQTKTPQVLELGLCKNSLPEKEVELYKSFQISNVLSHGMLDLHCRYVTYFGFAQIQGGISPHHLYLISFIVPHLHVAYARINRVQKKLKTSEVFDGFSPINSPDNVGVDKDLKGLSSRELEVLQWLLNGKSNWDIGGILNISEYTVKNHVQRILKKLNANSRQHAVAKALEMGLINL